jgi:hypothetical protein
MGKTDNYHFENLTYRGLTEDILYVLLILVSRMHETDIKAGLGKAGEELERNGRSRIIY